MGFLVVAVKSRDVTNYHNSNHIVQYVSSLHFGRMHPNGDGFHHAYGKTKRPVAWHLLRQSNAQQGLLPTGWHTTKLGGGVALRDTRENQLKLSIRVPEIAAATYHTKPRTGAVPC